MITLRKQGINKHFIQNQMEQAKTKPNTTKNTDDDILADYSPVFRVYKDGRVDRLNVVAPVPPSLDRKTGVDSKDITIFPEEGVSVRVFNPIKTFQNLSCRKMPLIMYCHGSGFCSGSTFSPVYHGFLNRLASVAKAVVVSVEYRKATEFPLPVAYDDCWDALLWIFSHDSSTPSVSLDSVRFSEYVRGKLKRVKNPIKDPWLESGKVDFSRIFVGGESSGANVAHQVVLRAGLEGHMNIIKGLILIQPFFWGKERIGDEVERCKRGPGGAELGERLWMAARWGSPASVDDPWMNPAKDTNLFRLGCRNVLVCLAQEDALRDRGLLYEYALKKSGWVGDVIVEETKGEDHAFHLIRPSSPNAINLIKQIHNFIHSTHRTHSRI